MKDDKKGLIVIFVLICIIIVLVVILGRNTLKNVKREEPDYGGIIQKIEFEKYDRGDRFSDEALEDLFNYYDDVDIFELDVIAICSEWTEYENLKDYANTYMNAEDLDGLDEKEATEVILEHLNNNTYFTQLSNGHVLVQDY